jgi:hypothetical protein
VQSVDRHAGRAAQRGSAARRAVTPLRFAFRRAAARLGPVALVATGIALAAAALATIWTVRVVVEDRAVADAVADFPAEQRALVVSWVGTDSADLPGLDREARRAVESFGMGTAQRAMVFRTTRLGGELVRIAALDDPSAFLEVRSGRAPASCRAARCEVLALDAPGRPLAAPGFTVVGQATTKAGAALDALVGSRTPGERVLIARDVDGLAAMPMPSQLFRTVTWARPLDPDALGAASLDDFERRVARENTRLRRESPEFDLRAPLQELAAAGAAATDASRRQLLVAGQCVALFLAFAVLAASRLRRDAQETQHRLRRFGALRWQVLAETVGHAAVVVVPAVAVGWLAGAAVGAGIAAAADRPAGATLDRSALSATGLRAAIVLAAVAVAAIVVTVRARGVEVGGLRLTVADVAAAGAIAAIVVAFGTGQNEADGADDSALLVLLPLLVAFAGSVIVARLLGPGFRAVERLAPRAGVSGRLALLSLVRTPGASALAVVFLVVTTGLAVFAATYRATLSANQRDAAAFAVPLDYVVSRDAVRSTGLGAPAPLAGHYGETEPVGVVRRSGEAPTLNRGDRLTVLGVPAASLERLRWRDDYTDGSPADLAAALSFGRRADLTGIEVPSGTRELAFPASVRGDPIRLTAQFRRPDGSFGSLDLRERGRNSRATTLPPGFAGGRLVALTLQFPPAEAFSAAHRAAESGGAPDVFLRGTLRLGSPVARGPEGATTLPVDYGKWVGPDGAGGGGSRRLLTVRYLLSRERVFRIRPRQVTDGRPVPVIASASLAAGAGGAVLPLAVGNAVVDVEIAATASRFPTVRGDFVVADRDVLETALNASAPGVAVADEVWLDGRPGLEQELRGAAPVPVHVTSRSALERRLRADPVARASSIALVTGALFALALALVGIVLAVALDLRDEAAELFDLEALGFGPAGLARHIWLRSLAVVVVGILGGLVTGAALALLVTDVVTVTTGLAEAEPPLRLVADWSILAGGLAAFAGLALASAALLARSAFRAPAPERTDFA